MSIADISFGMARVDRGDAWLLLAMIFSLLGGCATRLSEPALNASLESAQPTIELLGFPDCPNTPMLRANLESALAALGTGWSYTETNQELLPDGDLRRGWPTPTILVSGCDLFGSPAPTSSRMASTTWMTWMTCRIYADGVPTAAEIAERLTARSSR